MTQPLAGVRVLAPVTSERSAIADRIEAAGATVTRVEALDFAPSSTPAELEGAATDWAAGAYRWLAITSRVGVAAFADAARAAGVDLAARPDGTLVAAVGAATAEALADVGLVADLVPDGAADAVRMVAEFPAGQGRVLAPLGNLAAPTLAVGLRGKGWDVDVVEAYRTIDGPPLDPAIAVAVERGDIDVIALTSGSVATRLARELPAIPPLVAVVAIGASCARRASELGLDVAVVATEPSPAGMVEAIIAAIGTPTGAANRTATQTATRREER